MARLLLPLLALAAVASLLAASTPSPDVASSVSVSALDAASTPPAANVSSVVPASPRRLGTPAVPHLQQRPLAVPAAAPARIPAHAASGGGPSIKAAAGDSNLYYLMYVVMFALGAVIGWAVATCCSSSSGPGTCTCLCVWSGDATADGPSGKPRRPRRRPAAGQQEQARPAHESVTAAATTDNTTN